MAITAFEEGDSSSTALAHKIHAQIKSYGAIPYREFMASALYDPELGYYTSGRQRVGKLGDFITSVSIGRCFGLILCLLYTSPSPRD